MLQAATQTAVLADSSRFWSAQTFIPYNPNDFWTATTAILNLVLLFVAWRGLKSLKLTRASMLTQGMREARQDAIARAEEWASVVIPANAEILNLIAEHKVPVFVKNTAEVRFDPDNRDDVKKAAEWWRKLPAEPEIASKSLTQLNRIEAWAMHFTSGLADSDLAFKPCAPTFCRMIIQNYAFLLVLRAGNRAGRFPNAVQLYRTWAKLIEEEERGTKMANLLQQLEELQEHGTDHPVPMLPVPLGTKIDS